MENYCLKPAYVRRVRLVMSVEGDRDGETGWHSGEDLHTWESETKMLVGGLALEVG